VKQAQLRIITAPGTTNPPFIDGRFEPKPIACALKAEPGLSICHTVDGNPDSIITVFGCQTLDSLQKLLKPDVYRLVEEHSVDLACVTWGCPDTPNRSGQQPFYLIKGLKRNDRSAKNLPPGCHDGSYNLASTVGKGEGQGCVQPAVQVDTPEGRAQISEILGHLAFLGDIVLQSVLSRFEYEILQFHAKDNNIFGFGGLKPYATGCQANVASSSRSLADAIGQGQGSWHSDIGDDWTRFTVITMLLRLPPG